MHIDRNTRVLTAIYKTVYTRFQKPLNISNYLYAVLCRYYIFNYSIVAYYYNTTT